jgi:hypothetical protein
LELQLIIPKWHRPAIRYFAWLALGWQVLGRSARPLG